MKSQFKLSIICFLGLSMFFNVSVFAQKVYNRNNSGQTTKYFQANAPNLKTQQKTATTLAPSSNTKVISQAKSADGKATIKLVKGKGDGSYKPSEVKPQPIPNEIACYTENIVIDANADEETFLLNPAKTDVIYPGSVVDGNSIPSGGFSKILKAQKNIVLWTEGLNFAEPDKAIISINNPTAPYVNSQISQIVRMHSGVQAANFIFKTQEVKSREEISLSLGGHYSDLLNEVNALFTFDQSNTSQTFLLEFTQIYFTAFADVPASPLDFFVDASPDIPESWMYVSDVTYGRRGVLAISIKEQTQEMGLDASYNYNGFVTTGGADLISSLKKFDSNVTVRGWIKGGNPVAAANINTTDWKANIQNFFKAFKEGAKFDQNNPAIPLAYTLRFINDPNHEIGRLEQTLRYTRKTCDNSVLFRIGIRRFECISADDGSNSEEDLYGRIGISASNGCKIFEDPSMREVPTSAPAGSNINPFPNIWEVPDNGAHVGVRSGKHTGISGSSKIVQVPYRFLKNATVEFVSDGKTPSGGRRGIMEYDPRSEDEIYTPGVIAPFLLSKAYYNPMEVKQRFTQGSSKLDIVYFIERAQ